MLAILEIPEVRQRVSPLSLEEYHRLDEFNEHGRRTELIRGLIIEKLSKSPLHSSIGKLLYDRLLRLAPANLVVRREDPLSFADSEPEPDISVVQGTAADFSRLIPPRRTWSWKWLCRARLSTAKMPHSTRKPGSRNIGLSLV